MFLHWKDAKNFKAQSMDVLSSQSNLSGYKAVIDAASMFNKAFPLMMTSAGTVAPAKVLVIGAGVAGLQAIATAKIRFSCLLHLMLDQQLKKNRLKV